MPSPRQEEPGRPRAKSALSFTSHKSSKSHQSGESFKSGSVGKIDLTETSKDKRHLHTKADPNLATNEAQPSTIAQEESNLASLRSVQHKDVHGNPITDPDRSNPTRHRMERPLDTIRGFEEAWNGSYKRRTSSYGRPADRPDSRGTGLNGDFSRRSSAFFPGYQNNSPAPQGRGFQEGGYYGSDRNSTARPDSFIDQYSGPPSQFQGQGGRGYRPPPNARNNSDPMLYGAKQQRSVYPSHSYQQSYDTVLTNGSHQTEPWGNSTDPSSENSSLDRIQPMPKQNEQQQMSENYGLNGFGGNQQIQLNEYPQGMNQPGSGRNGYGQPGSAALNRFQTAPEPRPVPPPKAAAGPRVPIKLDSPSGSPLIQEVSRQVSRESTGGGKRKSWLMRRFSKK